MENLDHRWNNKVEIFNLKINKLRNEMNEYKKSSFNACSLKNKKVFFSKLNNNTKKRELININEYNAKNNLERGHIRTNVRVNNVSNMERNAEANNGINNGVHNIKNQKNNVIGNAAFPTSKNISNKIIKTNDVNIIENKNYFKFNVRNKRKNEKTIKINEKRWIIATKHTKVEKGNTNDKEFMLKNQKKKKKMKLLYLEGEEGNMYPYPIYSDSEVGFESISHIEDELLSKVKKENQDDDDIKTTKHLAQWSSNLVHKYLEEAIEKTKLMFHSSSIKWRHEEIFKRMRS
ncbi:conserved Plasmodium protein, unknown function [Plasmodium vinckei lentum]|uniref:Uncharacterized protein n=1 Tax=Plasmodium vinckei lentum TaxID=138297 RepID=A0A6V7SBL5_PLAVN|nr:conserved Plasmodium protein, unknown function [Plasmodium vinckei lentum]